MNIALTSGTGTAPRAVLVVKNPTTFIVHILFLSTVDGSTLNAFFDDTSAGSFYWYLSYYNSMVLDSSNFLYFGAYTSSTIGRTMVAKFDMVSTTTPNAAKWKWDHRGFWGTLTNSG